MDVALCTIDNNMYTLPVFEALSDLTLSYYRRHLLCPKCLGQAFYRKPSANGRPGSFSARPHGSQCAHPCREAGLMAPIDCRERIAVNFAPGDMPVVATHQRPDNLLNNLMFNPGFCTSEQLLEVDGGLFRAKDFFVPFAGTPTNGRGEYRGYWGFISDAGMSGEQPASLWLNSGGAQDLSIVVAGGMSGEFFQRFPTADLEALAGAYVLVFGRLRVSQFGKKYIALSDISRMALSLAP